MLICDCFVIVLGLCMVVGGWLFVLLLSGILLLCCSEKRSFCGRLLCVEGRLFCTRFVLDSMEKGGFLVAEGGDYNLLFYPPQPHQIERLLLFIA